MHVISFFITVSVVIRAVLQEVQTLSRISELALDTNVDGKVMMDKLADVQHSQEGLLLTKMSHVDIWIPTFTIKFTASQKEGLMYNYTSEQYGDIVDNSISLVVLQCSLFLLPFSFNLRSRKIIPIVH